ncbi:hypothetical protein Taro_024350 [Colocasia esculenta]|uniref:D-isomer specific 2-hydroxyacid dehydrogenase NAD-binding domain-containing protein n=1 Tax=Colocasia esculenta TaxID=4460 RepID=A0A843V930_COLES|nr:hypothetical protein [Colocasia esculenta]
MPLTIIKAIGIYTSFKCLGGAALLLRVVKASYLYIEAASRWALWGLGRVGTAVGKRAQQFGCRVNLHSGTQKPSVHNKCHPNLVDLTIASEGLVVGGSLIDKTLHIIDALGPEGILVR